MSTHRPINRGRRWIVQGLIVSGLGLVVAMALLVSTTRAYGQTSSGSAQLIEAAAGDPIDTDTSTPTPTDTPTAILYPTDTPTYTPSPSPTATNTATETQTPTSTRTPTDTPTTTPTSTNTATHTPTPYCFTLDIDSTEPLFMSSSATDRVSAYLANPDLNYPISLTNVTVLWLGSGSPASVWHDELIPAPSVVFDKYLWNGTTIIDPANRALTPGATFSDNLNGFAIGPNSNGYFALDFTASLQGSADQMYRHGRDWIIELEYVGGSVICGTGLQGRYGPVIQLTVPAVVNEPTFTVSADVTDPDPDGSITQVYFEVYSNAGGAPVYTDVEMAAPYCLGGESGGVCNPISSYAWPNGVPIDDGETYTMTIRARDNDPHRQYTRVARTLTFNQPPSTLTETPTPTFTPTATATSTTTSTPTATSTTTPTATAEPTPQYQVYLPLVARDVSLSTVASPDAIRIMYTVLELLTNHLRRP
ncbi:MAG TPA: hypothetical protein VMP08_02615 [Anaerolineae bacterium]|nr:hypothetical protein [Anaerolineae bacterium]